MSRLADEDARDQDAADERNDRRIDEWKEQRAEARARGLSTDSLGIAVVRLREREACARDPSGARCCYCPPPFCAARTGGGR